MVYNQENTTRVLNDLIRTLVEFRDLPGSPGQDQLEEVFQKLQGNRDSWWLDRQDNRWIEAEGPKVPKGGGVLAQLLGIRRPKPPKDPKK
jgi:hypothetical protein